MLGRIVDVISQGIQLYPGDFAHPVTQVTLQRLLGDIAGQGNFNIQSLIIKASHKLPVDRNTEWACSDSKLQAKLNKQVHEPLLVMSSPTSKIRDTQYRPNPVNPFTKSQWRLFMSHEDNDIARELTLMSSTLFSSLQTRDLLRHTTSPSTPRDSSSPCALTALTTYFNHLAHWTTNLILLRDKPKHRSLVLSKLMRVARRVRQQNDYNTLAALLAGIQCTAVYRLRSTWELVAPEQRKDFQRVEVLMASSKGCASYRLAWENTNTAKGRVPFLAVHQRDLVVAVAGGRTFIDDNGGNEAQTDSGTQEANTSFSSTDSSSSASSHPSSTKLQSTTTTTPSNHRLINWRKFEIIGTTLISIRAAQSTPYPASLSTHHHPHHEEIRSLVLDTVVLGDEEELYRRSCRVEAPAHGGEGVGVGLRGWMERRGWAGGVER